MGMTYAFASLAGSTGKTTSVTALGTLLARDGLSVRIVDLDSQANASHWLGYEDTHGKTIAEILRQTATVAEVELPARVVNGEDDEGEPVYGEIPNLTLLPARRSTLDAVMIELAGHPDGVMRLREALAEASPVDVTLIDCPGTMSTLVVSGIVATSISEDEGDKAWGVIACTTSEYKGLCGLPDLEKNIHLLRRTYRMNVGLLGIVPCAVPPQNSGTVFVDQMEDLRAQYGELVTPNVSRTGMVAESFANATPLPLYGYRAKRVSDEYRAVLDYMTNTLGLFPRRKVAA
ncbi:ParA family protein [Mycobacteroides abscessus]|uniref:ParA family protein n=2 Tax=Mycobacteroides abscessus TaxID=36809 RepID=UPI00092AC8B4|nr:ParA family protein [Mycobacteroides abscessus]MBL3752902.1 ParA family protein [Mycobacteroides abscessus subsp. massiliense]QCO28977.1 ParA family protein [Mycobacteroides abscessus subsp. massiliense]QSN49802.1 ParA family protein [Mycobacteroides abscessus subsp. abscessus]SHY27501.1 ATPase involved in chromosome partitioning [Mycobacteroides abscessus subsp. abscessus]SID72824.1 ATPase involved in chromosome partitioning [Mycobacteroides abscessus subsp. abscessus]